MQVGRLIHTTVNGRDQVFQTANYESLLNEQNKQTILTVIQPIPNFFSDDLAITNTTVMPDFEESGRMFYRFDTVILKFENLAELAQYLTAKERLALMQRAEQTFHFINRMITVQSNNGFELKNPLPKVTL